MKKRNLILVSLLLAGAGLAWFGLNWFTNREEYRPAFTEKDFAKAAAQMHLDRPTQPEVVDAAPIPPSHAVRLAIGWLGLPGEAQNVQVADLLTAELSGAKGLELVERQSLNRVLGELELSLSGLVRAKEAVRVGKLLKAEWFLLGSTSAAGASNVVVARIVDAGTGVMRDVAVFPCNGAPSQLAAKLADFVRGCRQASGATKPRVFLAVGTFEDLSLNNRLAEFPAQLRAQLVEAYQGSGVTLLERQYVDSLLQEVRLDLAGLTETSAGPLPRMQSAFWLVDGYYQSYETSGYEVELGLNIRRIFGRVKTVLLRDKPGAPLLKKAKAEIDEALSTQTLMTAPTRVSEVRAQMQAGKELFLPEGRLGLMGPTAFLINGTSGTADDRQRRNLEEAVRAFQTVLLFEPTNREAKLYLAATLRSRPLGREDEARQLYREVLDEPIHDKWVGTAQQALNASLRWASVDEKARWLQPVGLQSTNPSAQFFQRESRRAAVDAELQRGGSPKAQELAEERLFDTITNFDAGHWYQESIGMDDFADTFGADRAAAARRLVELYPKMKELAPGSAPYLLAAIVTFQVDTNAPVIAQFEQALNGWAEHPERMPRKITSFWNHIDSVYSWSQKHKLPALSAKILDAKLRANGTKPGGAPVADNEDKMRLAYGHKAAGRWADALKIFESYTNQPIAMGNSGPWGRAFTVILTSREAAECRKQLGLPSVQDPREFDLGKPLLCLHGDARTSQWELLLNSVGAFATAPDGLWLGLGGKLMLLDFNLTTNRVISLPLDATTPITCLCVTPAAIWIGTYGEGLVACDVRSRLCVRMTEKDGLLMDFVSSLRLAEDTLWVGYGSRSGGGLGKVDLRTCRLTSFTPSLAGEQGDQEKPPRVPVVAIAPGDDGDLWFVSRHLLRRYRSASGRWEASAEPAHIATVARGADTLFIGMGSVGTFTKDEPAGLGLRTLSLKGGQAKTFPPVAGLPTGVITLMLDGPNVWVGGQAFVALLDPVHDKVLKFAYVSARHVDQLQVGGGCIWAQCDKHLYKARL